MFIIRAGRWALLLSEAYLPEAVAVLSTPGTFDRVSLGGEGGEGGREAGEGVAASERLVVVVLVSASCYTLAGFAFVRHLMGQRLVSVWSFFIYLLVFLPLFICAQ